jgi:protein-S-isoprenylcysteine O-methyltransferase
LQIAIRSAILGYVFGIGIFISATLSEKYKSFGIYLAFLSLFHYSEYLTISITHPQSLTLDSFMMNHSLQYELAAIISWIEFFTEVYFYPGVCNTYCFCTFNAHSTIYVLFCLEMKSYKSLWLLGSLICLLGEILRKTAMLTAKKSFHHLVIYF